MFPRGVGGLAARTSRKNVGDLGVQIVQLEGLVEEIVGAVEGRGHLVEAARLCHRAWRGSGRSVCNILV